MKKIGKYLMAFLLTLVMVFPMSSTIKAEAAELYLAYQTNENGVGVTKLKSSERENYRVSELYMEEGQQIDLCFINATSWTKPKWTSSNTDVATVDKSGIITAVSSGVTEITLTYSKILTGKQISASAKVYVGEENWNVTFEFTDQGKRNEYYEIMAGEEPELTFEGMNHFNDTKIWSVFYESSNTDVLEISGSSMSIKDRGTVTITLNLRNKVTGNVLHKRMNVQCYRTIADKMDAFMELIGAVGGNANKVYFTVNQKSCTTERVSGHGSNCTNCNMRDIAKATWFINLFGTVNVDNFPEHDVNSSRRDHTGQSCFGFACFLQWYLYAKDNSDKVTSERVAAVKFNKENMEKYVQPGDVVRVNGHSVVVYSIEKNGLMVIDSNWNSGGQLNCLAQKHLLDYNNKYYKGYTAYINRVIGIDTVKSSVTETPTNTPSVQEKQYATLDLSGTGWNTYNVGLDKEMNADKAYPISNGAKLEVLGEYINAKGNKVYQVFSYDLNRECYISAKYVKIN